ncbi:MAG: hypothetical protein FWE44_01880, partial [Defluviitaleaceae bacterium]|nr:hypothetical protein [Defluviitaleaceae bacterium]
QDDAQKVLEFAIEAGSEISQTYILLSDIYAAQRNTRALIALKNTLDTRNMPGKKTALDHIETLL